MIDTEKRLAVLEKDIAKLRKKAEGLTQLDVFGNSPCTQSNMFGNGLQEIRTRVNQLLDEQQEIRE